MLYACQNMVFVLIIHICHRWTEALGYGIVREKISSLGLNALDVSICESKKRNSKELWRW